MGIGIIIKIIGYLLLALAIRDAYKSFKSDRGLIKLVYFRNCLDYLWAFLLVLGVIISVSLISLVELPYILKFSWISFITSGESRGSNLATTPLSSGYVLIVLIFWVVMTLCLPYLAKIEEIMFRSNVLKRSDRIKKSIIFGLIHMIMGIPLYIALVICVMGYIYSYKYYKAYIKGGDELGLEASTSLHAKYNFILITFGCLATIISLI
jgi:membrane protease YdiL (CAAX protease family)